MLGGWESFFGRAGEYHQSPLAEVLPVVMQSADDRHNCAQPCLIHKVAEHPILEGLPWDQPPGIGGFNVVTAKPDAETLLTCVEFSVRRTEASVHEFTAASSGRCWSSGGTAVGADGRGRTAALATDVAPHWVGGLVDWGDRRVVQDVAGECVEVGNWYATVLPQSAGVDGKLGQSCRQTSV